MDIVTIKNIVDGDTIILKTTGMSFTSRARWIDTPEIKQWFKPENSVNKNQWFWGNKARYKLIELIKDKNLYIREYERDVYGRSLSDWYLNEDSFQIENNLQIQMIRLGLAVPFLPSNLYDFREEENELNLYCEILRSAVVAKKNGIGVWGDPNFKIPYQYRKSPSGKF